LSYVIEVTVIVTVAVSPLRISGSPSFVIETLPLLEEEVVPPPPLPLTDKRKQEAVLSLSEIDLIL
jgi:hypothetical protein